MPEERTLVANLVPQVADADLQAFKEELSKDFKSVLSFDIGDAFKPSSQSGGSGGAGDIVEDVKETKEVVDDVVGAVKETKEAIDTQTEVIKDVMTETKDIVEDVKDVVEEANPPEEKKGLKEALGKGFLGLKDGFGDALDAFKKNPGKAMMSIWGAVLLIFDMFKKMFDRVVSASPFLQRVLGLFGQALDLILGPLGTAIGMELIPILTDMYDRIMKGVQAIWKAYEEDGLSGMIKETFNTLWEVFKPLIPEIAEVIGVVMQQLLIALGETIWGGLVDVLERIGNQFNDFVLFCEAIFGGIVDVLTDIWNAMTGMFGGVGDVFGGIADFFGFAEGGFVEPRDGGTLIRVGEGGEREYIVPQSKVSSFVQSQSSTFGGTVNYYYITVNGYTDTDLTDKIVSAIDQRTAMSDLRGGI